MKKKLPGHAARLPEPENDREVNRRGGRRTDLAGDIQRVIRSAGDTSAHPHTSKKEFESERPFEKLAPAGRA
jgi:hypothetical protein